MSVLNKPSTVVSKRFVNIFKCQHYKYTEQNVRIFCNAKTFTFFVKLIKCQYYKYTDCFRLKIYENLLQFFIRFFNKLLAHLSR